MCKKIGILILACLMSLLACKKSERTQISGNWVESGSRADTLVFMDDNMFSLKRGTELIDSHSIPKRGSGSYKYHLKPDSIGLKYLLSSNSNSRIYKFVMDGGKIQIGDFYHEAAGKQVVLVFERLR